MNASQHFPMLSNSIKEDPSASIDQSALPQAHTPSGESNTSAYDDKLSGIAATGSDGLLEQKIFPGIVHERVQRGNVLGRPDDLEEKESK
ncbi:hypothetical protein P175DRAFT_0496897 [Aspergillus ochraceoroseus IBT 24754]|uniref:Uncharacterized protein n=1 Tax=Aspergillus ochraceoroseus IBT 24754 TaxID=1392256 RepID=A0A2T5M5E3_9EURO|nr:uncharacterized protein P175DRAFT_0496897 [Aspergillus ochraceoroseus IBT 24754]PTU23760.1 hypothetical protein P175DRAFT_0496897 [Aspergillus ochraceoroseus IBT 24754]